LCINNNNENCLSALINDTRESGVTLDPEKFDNAVSNRCCEYCQAGWESSKSIRIIKKRLTGIKQSMHALARQLLKEKEITQPVATADRGPLGRSG